MFRFLKRYFLLKVFLIFFVMMNVIAAFHAYKFTHFTTATAERTLKPEQLSIIDKATALLFGVSNPKPRNTELPNHKFDTVVLKSNKQIHCWWIQNDTAKGNVLLFHGYGGEKSSMLDKAEIFLQQGYNVLLVDFMGCGSSEGNQTTIGFKEAEDVKTCFDFVQLKNTKPLYLFGTSMGAVAILKAIADYQIAPTGIMVECPFGTMYKTTCARFNNMGLPSFPMANLLVFWGGVENGFWAFGHNPEVYASSVTCPALLMYGAKDKNVSREEIEAIYANFKGLKQLKIYANAGHENYLIKYKNEWQKDVQDFLSSAK